MAKRYPTLDKERQLLQAGHRRIAGLDEAGRGAWAGPVVAAAVILPLEDPALSERLQGVCDSKLCTPRQREALYERIRQVALTWATASVPAFRIDEIGIVPSTRQAMQEAIAKLSFPPQALLIDALRLPQVALPQNSFNKGDLLSLTIAAASILAKVTRDREMVALDDAYPGYSFGRHKGYGTRQHLRALQDLGPLEIHRWSFAPVSAVAMGLKPDGQARPTASRSQRREPR
jgi:ribonuclease HII